MGNQHANIAAKKAIIEEEGGTHLFELHLPSAGLSMATVLLLALGALALYLCYRAIPTCCRPRAPASYSGAHFQRHPDVDPLAMQAYGNNGRAFQSIPMGLTMTPAMHAQMWENTMMPYGPMGLQQPPRVHFLPSPPAYSSATSTPRRQRTSRRNMAAHEAHQDQRFEEINIEEPHDPTSEDETTSQSEHVPGSIP